MDYLHHITWLIRQLLDTQWAPLVLFFWTILEGETCLIIAGAFATDGCPRIELCILAAFAGSLTGDQLWFYIGRRKGTALLARRPIWKQKAQKVFDILHEHSTWLILGFRFLYGLRNVTPFAIGMTTVRWRRFLLLNAIGAAVWAITFGMGGYLFGTAFEDKHHRGWAITVIAVVIFTIWLVRGIAKSIRQRREKKLANALLQADSKPEPQPTGKE